MRELSFFRASLTLIKLFWWEQENLFLRIRTLQGEFILPDGVSGIKRRSIAMSCHLVPFRAEVDSFNAQNMDRDPVGFAKALRTLPIFS